MHNLPLHQVQAFIDSLDTLNDKELKETLVKFANNTYEENSVVIKELIPVGKKIRKKLKVEDYKNEGINYTAHLYVLIIKYES